MSDYDETRPSLIACLFWEKIEKGELWDGIEDLINNMIDAEFVVVTLSHLQFWEQKGTDRRTQYRHLIELCKRRIKELK